MTFESGWKAYATRALKWLKSMIHPDGEVSFFNDSAKGIAPSPKELFKYAESLGINCQQEQTEKLITLQATGYSRINYPRHTVLFDHAAVGPDYLPGHAHADTLSLEWSIGEHRVLVNSGTSVYGVSAERLRQRKTAAHNTVEVDGVDSSEVWSGFRVARRAYSELISAVEREDTVDIMARHNGYMRLKGKVTHTRTISVKDSSLKILDTLSGTFKNAVVYWHLEPSIVVSKILNDGLILSLSDGTVVQFKTDMPFSVEPSSWHPEFGTSVLSEKITIQVKQHQTTSLFKII